MAAIVLISKRTRSSLTSSTFFRWYCRYSPLQQIHKHSLQRENSSHHVTGEASLNEIAS
jgi:hypothetical protein